MPQGDFFMGNENDKESFSWATEVNDNLKAFEWYIAICLLENDHEAVKDAVSRYKELGYKKLPIHVQEALCIFYGAMTIPDLHGYQIDPQIMQKCIWFFQTLRRYNNNFYVFISSNNPTRRIIYSS